LVPHSRPKPTSPAWASIAKTAALQAVVSSALARAEDHSPSGVSPGQDENLVRDCGIFRHGVISSGNYNHRLMVASLGDYVTLPPYHSHHFHDAL
jgi:hypothetical protein